MPSKTGYRVRKRGDTYFVDFRLPGIPRFRRSLKTGNACQAAYNFTRFSGTYLYEFGV